MKIKMGCVAVWMLAGHVFAGVPAEVFHQIDGFLKRNPDARDEFWEVAHGGYIFRLDVDITGDGVPELFLSNSMEMNRGNPDWVIYRGLPTGGYETFSFEKGNASNEGFRKVREPLLLRGIYGLEVVNVPNGSVVFERWHNKYASDEAYWGADMYLIKGNKVRFDRKLGEDYSTEVANAINTRRLSLSDMKGVLIADLLRHPDTKWREMDSIDNVPNSSDHWVHKDDEARVARLGAFTPELARKWLKTARLGKEPEGDTSAYDSPAEPVPKVDPEAEPVSDASVASPDSSALAVNVPVQTREEPLARSSPELPSESPFLDWLRKYPPGAIALAIALLFSGCLYLAGWFFRSLRRRDRVRFSRN